MTFGEIFLQVLAYSIAVVGTLSSLLLGPFSILSMWSDCVECIGRKIMYAMCLGASFILLFSLSVSLLEWLNIIYGVKSEG